jgi:hypothetical protein
LTSLPLRVNLFSPRKGDNVTDKISEPVNAENGLVAQAVDLASKATVVEPSKASTEATTASSAPPSGDKTELACHIWTHSRRKSLWIRRPSRVRRGRWAISVGTGGNVTGYETDGIIYRALFTISPGNRVHFYSWTDSLFQGTVEQKQMAALQAIDQLLSDEVKDNPTFRHWCSRICYENHSSEAASVPPTEPSKD